VFLAIVAALIAADYHHFGQQAYSTAKKLGAHAGGEVRTANRIVCFVLPFLCCDCLFALFV